MAPEQLLSEDFDERADLFSMGVVLFECLTGRLPFEGTTIVSIIAHLMRDEAPSPSALNPEVPAHVSAMVLQLLAKEPAGRPSSASDVVQRLAALS
jgi:serine/threonine protein kinase